MVSLIPWIRALINEPEAFVDGEPYLAIAVTKFPHPEGPFSFIHSNKVNIHGMNRHPIDETFNHKPEKAYLLTPM